MLFSNVVVLECCCLKTHFADFVNMLIEKISLVLSQHLHLNLMEPKQQDHRPLNHPLEPKREGVSETKEKASNVVVLECCCCLKTHFADFVHC